MTAVTTRVHVADDSTISGRASSGQVPPGDHEEVITVPTSLGRQDPAVPFDVDELPRRGLGPWPEGLSLRREEMYGDDGR